MKTKFNGILTLLLAFVVQFSFAQEKTISGTVSDESGPLPGVSVLKKGTTQGTETDFDGNYSIKAKTGDVLVFSFVGMETVEKVVGSSNSLNVSMQTGNVLDEIVVTALGVEKVQRSVGNAVTNIKGSDLTAGKEGNIVNALSGKVSGVSVSNSATIGGSSRVTIRGVNSINGNNQPLFIVDGIPMDNSNFNSSDAQKGAGGTDFGSAIQDINPNDIKSVSVLKGGSAAVLYGSRAANGVILITTKSGRAQKGIGIEFNQTLSIENVYGLPNYQNQYAGGYTQEITDGRLNYGADESWGPEIKGQLVRQWYSWFPDDSDYGKATPLKAHPNNVKDFYQTGLTRTSSISLNGSTDKGNMRLSYTNSNQTGVVPVSEIKKNNLSFKGDIKLTDKIRTFASVNYSRTDGFGRPEVGYSFGQGEGSGRGAVVTSFNQWFQRQVDIEKLRQYNSEYALNRSWNITSPTNLKPAYWDNPFWALNNNTVTDYRQRIFGNIGIDIGINDYLTLTSTFNTDFYNDRRQSRITPGSNSYYAPNGRYSESLREVQENNFDVFLKYNKDISKKVGFNALIGASTRRQEYYNNYGQTEGGLSVPGYWNLKASKDRPTITDLYEHKEVNSVLGSANISYNNLLFLELSFRNDWSSTLPKENNSYFYPGANFSFVFSDLLKNSFKSLNYGKLRAGWAQVGNDTDPYKLKTTYTSTNAYGSNPTFAVPNTLNNENLKPEKVTTWEIGTELAFLENKIRFDFTYYDVKSEDQIIDISVPSTSGSNKAFVNAGMLTNKGYEVSLGLTPVKNENFKWDINFNWSKNTNKVVRLAEGLTNYEIASWGPSINAKVGEAYGTFITDGFKYDENGNKLVGDDGLFIRETNKTFGSYMPDWTGGISNNISYKGFDLSFLIDVQKGGNLYSVTNRYGSYSGLLQETVGLNDKGNPVRDAVADGGGVRADGVKADGTKNDVYVDAQAYFKHLRLRREAYIYDASFVKLREVRLAYNLSQDWLDQFKISSMSLALVGRNLAVLHKNIPNVDPQQAYGSGNVQGFENGGLPPVRSIGLNLNVKF